MNLRSKHYSITIEYGRIYGFYRADSGPWLGIDVVGHVDGPESSLKIESSVVKGNNREMGNIDRGVMKVSCKKNGVERLNPDVL